MIYQLSWKTLPGLKGLACSDFRAVPIPPGAVPDTLSGVAVELDDEAEEEALIGDLEARFAAERFMNTAAAFDTVKGFILEWSETKNF